MKLFQTALLSVAALLLSGSLAFGQSMGGAGGTTPATGGTPPAGGATPTNPVEKDIDLPVDQPQLKLPPQPPQPPPPPTPVDKPNPPPTIYGKDLKSENGTIIYVIDISGSMGWDMGQYTTPDGKTANGCRLDRAKAELTKSVMTLPKSFKFNMFSFDCGVYQWQGGLVDATDANKSSGMGWISQLQPQGATGTGPAMSSALGLKDNKLVVLLTDGAPNCGAGDESGDSSCLRAHLSMVTGNNSQHAVINVFGIGATGEFKQFCMDVASQNGGNYVDVR